MFKILFLKNQYIFIKIIFIYKKNNISCLNLKFFFIFIKNII
jgi:hypothetical protein